MPESSRPRALRLTPTVARLAAVAALAAAGLACATSSTPPPDAGARATGLAQTAAALLTSTAFASITPVTPTPPPTDTPVPPTATNTSEPQVAPTTAVPPPTTAAPPCTGENDSEFVSDVNVPDGTHFAAGTAFNKTWRLRNDGDCTWTIGYQIRHVADNAMGGAPTNLPNDVPPGATVDITVALVAPSTNGTHISRWQLHTPDGTPFGTRPYVEIIVP